MFNSASRTLALTLSMLALLAVGFAPAANASASAVIQACSNEQPLGGFSKKDLESALGSVPDDIDQYFQCTAKINAALVDKLTKNVPGKNGKGIKGQQAKLRAASVNDLTTSADRAKAKADVARATKLDSGDPFADNADPAIRAAGGNTLASTAAPNTPVALIVGVLGLLLLLGADLASRLGLPGVKKLRSGSDQRDPD